MLMICYKLPRLKTNINYLVFKVVSMGQTIIWLLEMLPSVTETSSRIV